MFVAGSEKILAVRKGRRSLTARFLKHGLGLAASPENLGFFLVSEEGGVTGSEKVDEEARLSSSSSSSGADRKTLVGVTTAGVISRGSSSHLRGRNPSSSMAPLSTSLATSSTSLRVASSNSSRKISLMAGRVSTQRRFSGRSGVEEEEEEEEEDAAAAVALSSSERRRGKSYLVCGNIIKCPR